MSDEWIEHRSLRGRRPPPIEPLLPSDEPEEEFEPRFITPTGELRPLTDETIAMIEAMIEAQARGDEAPDVQPMIEVESGRFEPISQRSLDELVRNAQQHSRRRHRPSSVPPASPPHWDTLAGVPPIKDSGIRAPRPEDYLPWFETSPGGLPPIIDEPEDEEAGEERIAAVDNAVEGEIVEAEWVRELGAEVSDTTVPSAGQLRAPGPVTQQLLQAVQEGRLTPEGTTRPEVKRWGSRAVLILLGVTALIIAALFVPDYLDLTTPSTGEPEAEETPQVEVAAPAITQPPAPTAPPEPSPTLLPYMQGRIAFASSRDGDFDIYVFEWASGEVTPLTINDAADRSPAWSPDGSRIVFVSDRNGDDDLFVMNADGSNQIQLTTSTALDHSPGWSPDGQRVVFSRESVNGADLLTFATSCMTTPGACEDNLSAITAGRYDLDPTYSPDGARIAYASADSPGMQSAIGIATSTGEGATILPGTDAADSYPAWSPDGTQLAFISNVFGDYDLWITFVPADATTGDVGSVIQITRSESSDIQPVWSPDGKYIMFASDRGERVDFDLYLVPSDCLVSSALTCDDATLIIVDSPGDDLDPAWVQ
ncbi:MAG: PD40 domain-containing protein [Anaerolineae bacterium]|nr:PD40 domain-containing protein [Anaerolineae bacterium]